MHEAVLVHSGLKRGIIVQGPSYGLATLFGVSNGVPLSGGGIAGGYAIRTANRKLRFRGRAPDPVAEGCTEEEYAEYSEQMEAFHRESQSPPRPLDED